MSFLHLLNFRINSIYRFEFILCHDDGHTTIFPLYIYLFIILYSKYIFGNSTRVVFDKRMKFIEDS